MTGLAFALNSVCYVIGAPLLQFIPPGIDKRAVMIVGGLIVSLCVLLMGPSLTLNLPQQVWLIYVGFCVLGFVIPAMIVPNLPELIDAAKESLGKRSNTINDFCAGLFNSFLGIGQTISPIYSSYMYGIVGYQYTCDSVAAIGLAYVFIYFLGVKGW